MKFDKSVIRKGFNPRLPWFPNVDGFIPRTGIVNHITRSMSCFNGTLLDVGCGFMPYRSYIEMHSSVNKYIGMDLEIATTYASVKPDISWNGFDIPLSDNCVDSVLLTEVLEHCPYPEKVLQEICRVLKPGGKIVFTVPFVWNLHESPYDFFRYTPFAIKKIFADSFLDLEDMYVYGVSSYAFLNAYFIWLKRGSLPKWLRFFFYLISLPIIGLGFLIPRKFISRDFEDNLMFTGICGVAVKNGEGEKQTNS